MDSYIDAFETVIYGKLACEEMRTRAMTLHPAWGSAIGRGIELQESANARMEEIVSRMVGFKIDAAEVATVTDVIVRFGAWMDSLKGRPLDPVRFFGSAPPSTVGRRRLTKLAGHLDLMITRLTPYAEGEESGRIDGAASRLAELREAHAIAVRNRDAQRSALEAQKMLSPEAETARQEWLATYVANKRLVEGVLRHHGLTTLMPLIFDDLAEVQRTKPSEPSFDPLLDEPVDGDPTGDPTDGGDPTPL